MNNQTLEKVNKWSAEKCGAETRINNIGELCYRIGKGKDSHFEVWTILDPRCREIFISWWLADTNSKIHIDYLNKQYRIAIYDRFGKHRDVNIRDTLSDVWIACIIAIMESTE